MRGEPEAAARQGMEELSCSSRNGINRGPKADRLVASQELTWALTRGGSDDDHHDRSS